LKEFFNSLNIWQSYGKEDDCFKRPVLQGTVLLKEEQVASGLTYGGHELLYQHQAL